MKRFYLCLTVCLLAALSWAQGVKPLPTLHVEGKWLADQEGNHVVLHGVMDTPNMYFNDWRWGSPWDGSNTGYNTTGVIKCLNYFEKILTALEQAKCNVFRLHLDPAWTNDPSSSYTYSGAADQPAEATSEADISKFNPNRLRTFLSSLYWPLMQKAMNHGMYVVVRPPGVCPPNLKVGDYYQQYLMTVWDIVSSNTNIKKYAGQISIELANEPVSLKNANNADDPKALHDYFQPIVDKIRANGFKGIIWAPGTGWQANYTSYASYPIEGYNIGYAVHDYCGWYGCSDSNPDAQNKIKNFHNQVPVVDTAPIIITEVDWSPENPNAEGHYDEHGNWVLPNYGTWATGSTSKWGAAYKAMLDHYGNISMTLSGTGCLIDIDAYINNKVVTPAFNGLEEACGKACMDWYADYYDVNWPHADIMEYGDDMLTVEKLEVAEENVELMIGNASNPSLTATYLYGHTAFVGSMAEYEANSDVVAIENGQIKGVKEGKTDVTARYTDPLGNMKEVTFNVNSTFFPLGAKYITTNLFADGTYDESTHTFRPGQWGQMGWVYSNGADMSGYKYLVIKLKSTSSSSHLNIFTENSIWSACCSTPDFSSKKQIVLNLKTATYTSDGDKKGQSLDTKNIRIVSFWGNGSQSIVVSDMYLTNNSDYSREKTTSIKTMEDVRSKMSDVWYDMQGRRLGGKPTAPGIYIVGKRKVIVR